MSLSLQVLQVGSNDSELNNNEEDEDFFTAPL
jgi:hypothetical protein